MDNVTEKVSCIQCGAPVSFPVGFLTEGQRSQVKCQACVKEPVVERQVVERESDGRKLLIEG